MFETASLFKFKEVVVGVTWNKTIILKKERRKGTSEMGQVEGERKEGADESAAHATTAPFCHLDSLHGPGSAPFR